MRRLVASVALALAVILPVGAASATDSPDPTPTPTTTTTEPSPDPTPTDGIREVPTEDEGADAYSVITILVFFAIAMGIFVLIIRAGMRAADRED